MTRSAPAGARDPATPHSEEQFPIVGLGASAGGIAALKQFFDNVRPDSGAAYVVILHLSPEHESRLAAVLQSSSVLPVMQVTERVHVEPNRIYVIAPDCHLVMQDDLIVVEANTSVAERRAPVDIFFRTLADSHASRAVCVVLSGTGANGSMGLKRVKEQGGAAFVQDPREAEFDEMPRNSIATGLVDGILPVAEIPARIAAYAANLGQVSIAQQADLRYPDHQAALREIFVLLRSRTGHDFSSYKRPTLLRRIERRIHVHGLPDIRAYVELVRARPDETEALLNDILITVTNFFRDREAFEVIQRDVIPRIIAGKTAVDQVRIWVVGCATGEEAYGLAMLCAEQTAGVIDSPKVQIFATDIDATALARARNGLYSLNDAADLSPERMQRFFTREGDDYRVQREIREMILFANHNVIKDPPFSHLDLVSCRNVLIYLEGPAQQRVLETAHFALEPGGYLFLGTSESVGEATDLFVPVNRDAHIFQSRPGVHRYPVADRAAGQGQPAQAIAAISHGPSRGLARGTFGDLHQQLLERYAPPSLVINEEQEIVHLSPAVGRYLQVAGGEPSNNLLQLIRQELRLELRTALYQATSRGIPVEVQGLTVAIDNRDERINIHVRPVISPADPARGFLLVLFEPAGEQRDAERAYTSDDPVARQLEQELIRLKLQLRSTSEAHEIQAEELRASNEELQAMNEELRSAAEELETSREELQSINEELRTVNQELNVKIEEVSLTSNNLRNLVHSTNIATIFLDRTGHVHLFSPAARAIFNLVASDVGRPLSDITGKLVDTDLTADAMRVLETLHSLEHEVRTVDGEIYLMRILPYRTADDRIQGIVATFTDITDRKHAEEALKGAYDELETRVGERTAELATANVSLREEIAERQKAEEGRLRLQQQLVNAQEGERRRISRELHDQLGQEISALSLKLSMLKTRVTDDALRAQAESLEASVRKIDSDLEFLVWELRPTALDDLGLREALADYASTWSTQFGIEATFHAEGMDGARLEPEIETVIYRIVQEALNNVSKHAGAKNVDIVLSRDGEIRFTVTDDGVGFEPSQRSGSGAKGLGLIGMRERAALVGGSIEIQSSPGGGTRIIVHLPLPSTVRAAQAAVSRKGKAR